MDLAEVTETLDLKHHVGDTQFMSFTDGDSPPIHDCGAPQSDTLDEAASRKREMVRAEERTLVPRIMARMVSRRKGTWIMPRGSAR